jgi:hypothetical protein
LKTTFVTDKFHIAPDRVFADHKFTGDGFIRSVVEAAGRISEKKRLSPKNRKNFDVLFDYCGNNDGYNL